MRRFSLPSLERGRSSEDVSRHEAFRVLRTNLEIALLELDPPTVIITSPHAREGKTATCAQLARSFAEAGRRVLAVDLDLRHADLHTWFGLDNERGASDVLGEHCRLEDALRFVEVPSVAGEPVHAMYVLTAGTRVANPTELLGTDRMERLLTALAVQSDLVLIDTPPVLPVADTLVIARIASGALLIVDDDTSLDAARAVKEALVRNQVRMLGVVLNRFELRKGAGYGYGDAADGEE